MEYTFSNLFLSKENRIAKKLSLAIEHSIEITKEHLSFLQENGLSEYYSLPNLNLFSVIALYDLDTLITIYMKSRSKHEKNLLARFMAMIILEYIGEANILIGKNILPELQSNNLIQFTNEYKTINKELSKLKKGNENYLRTVRNTITAHRVKDALSLANEINLLKTSLILTLSMDLNRTITKLINLISRTIKTLNSNIKEKIDTSR